MKSLQTTDDIADFLEVLAEKSFSVYWLSAPDLKNIKYISPAYEEIWGRDRDELYKHPELWMTYLHPDDAKNHCPETMLERIKMEGATARFEDTYRIVRPDGEIRWIMDRSFPVYNHKGECFGITGVAIDVTQQKLAELALEKAKTIAEEANQAKGLFLSLMSHEMRGPIANVITAVDFLKPEQNYSAEIKTKMVEAIESAARDALNILQNTLHYVELDSKDFHQRMTTVFLPGFLAKLENQYAVKTKEGVKFSCKLLHAIERVKFDFMHSIEVLRILIDNALKFTEQGSIILSVRLVAPRHIRFTLQDTGIGIDEKYLDNIFKRLLDRDSSKIKQSYVKTGLKLPLAKRIAELASGTLQIKSKPGKGTIAELDMPYVSMSLSKGGVAKPLALDANEETDMLTHTAENCFPFSVLLIEDDPTTAFLESEALKGLGCIVTWADAGFKAIEILNGQTFDLIFVDITLPDMTGIELTELIKPTLPETTQLVALTSHSSDSDHECFLRYGMMTMLGKPVTQADFKKFFQGYLRMLDSEDE